MYPNPELKTLLLDLVLIGAREGLLNLDSALDGVYSTGELSQHTIPRCICDPSAVFRDQPVHDLTMRCEGVERLNLVPLHQARIASHVSREDRCEPSLDPVLLPIHGTLSAVPERSLLRMG
jgi:hypothetical protein